MKKEETFESKKARVARFNAIDDTFLHKLFEDRGACEDIIRIILDNNSIKVVDNRVQYSLKNIAGHSVILDALCTDSTGRYFNIEVQKADNDNHIKRARYNAACVTTNTFSVGEKYELVPDVTVIYISTFDIFKQGKILYRASMKLDDTFEEVNDGIVEYFVNTVVKSNSVLGELMEYFVNTNGVNRNFPRLSERVKELKESEGGIATMCEIMEQERTEGRTEGKMETLFDLVNDGLLTNGQAAMRLDLSPEEFDNLLEEYNKG